MQLLIFLVRKQLGDVALLESLQVDIDTRALVEYYVVFGISSKQRTSVRATSREHST